jgi:tetratricopeptide (TPR) repeat protein
VVYRDLGETGKAMDWAARGLATTPKSNLQLHAGLNNVQGYLELDRIPPDTHAAIRALRRSERLYTRLLGTQASARWSEAGIYFGTIYHNLGYAYEVQGDLDEALEWYRRSLRLKRKMGNSAGVANTTAAVAVALYKKGQLNLASKWRTRARELCQSLRLGHVESEMWRDSAGIALSRGRRADADRWITFAEGAVGLATEHEREKRAVMEARLRLASPP